MKKIALYLLLLSVAISISAQKKDSPEYRAQRQASVIAMDSILKHAQKMPVDIILKFADDLCKKYKNDPVLMDSIAEGFYRFYNNEVFGERRYGELKKLHPEYTQVYLNEARLFHSMSWTEDAEGWHVKTDLLEKAKVKIDSAKIMMPNSPEPYLLWMRLQSPFRHTQNSANVASIDEELKQCKAKFPDYPCYLDAARQYEEILAKKDKTLLLDAAEFYEKAGEYNELTAPYWTNYALTVYQYYNSFETPDYGVTIANKGLSRFPNYPGLIRAKLWNESVYEKWDDIIETSKALFQYGDTLEPSYLDYKYIAQAYQMKKDYEQAIENYIKEISFIKRDTAERLKAMLSLVNCYNRINPGQYEKAIALLSDYEHLKRSSGRKMELYDYNPFINAYELLGTDTLIDVALEKRMESLLIADSLLQLCLVASPEYTTRINQQRLDEITMFIIKLKYGDMGNTIFSVPEVLEAAERLEACIKELPNIQEDMDYYRLMKAYYYKLLHYWMGNQEEDAFNTSETMLSVDMPSDMELVSLSNSKKNEYNSFLNRARQVNDIYRPKYGKKKKGRR